MTPRARLLAGLGCVLLVAGVAAAELPTPEVHFGVKPGSDGLLVDYEQILDYLKVLDAASPRVELREIGKSPLGKPMVVAFISTADNIRRLDELHAINRRLALDPSIPDAERTELLAKGRVFMLATLSMHANELAPAQSFPLYAHELASSQDPDVVRQLDDVVWMVVPAHNPDGLDMVVANYRKNKGTKWEGASLPSVYHRYVGHDNNRDFVTLTQEDNRAVSRIMSTEWFPQVMVEKHGMGSSGPRFYCPPSNDPIAENIEAGVWSWIAVFGTGMANDMVHDGLTGVAQHWAFDDYWPGST
ncbi:MAG TPA: M14 family zinc carboxypeptidase, partial [Thermoanaerobaculaceae bacterium]|nr:M14 family zinc carboxypeptidase [Thermoanaerobaculaceae bacterium]